MRSVTVRGLAVGVFALLLLQPVPAGALDLVSEQPIAAPVRREPEVSREEALAAIQRWVAVPQGGTHQLDAYFDDWGPRPAWVINYLNNTQDGYGRSHSVGRVDAATGKVLEFQVPTAEFRPIRTGPLKQPYNEMDGWYKAWELVQQLHPELVGRIKSAPAGLGGSGVIYYPRPVDHETWTFTWFEQVQGIPNPSSFVEVSVDRQTLEYLSYRNGLLDQVRYLPGEVKLSPEEAQELLRDRNQPRLSYQPVYSKAPYFGPARSMALVYHFGLTYLPLDPVTGLPLGTEPRPDGEQAAPGPQPVPAGDPTKAIRPGSLPVTHEAAEAMLAPLLEGLPEGARWAPNPGRVVFDASGPLDRIYLRVESTDGQLDGYAELEPGTGRIMNAYALAFGPAEPREFTEEDHARAFAMATELVQRLYPDVASELRVYPGPLVLPQAGSRVQFYFQRYVNDIPVTGDGVNIGIDLAGMHWSQIYFTWTDGVEFPDPGGAMAAEEALERYLAGRRLHLIWHTQSESNEYPGGYYPRYEQAPPDWKAALTYRLSRPIDRPDAAMLNALTGEELDYSGNLILAPAAVDRLLAGHWAEGELRYLAAAGGIDLSVTELDQLLSRGEALKILLHGSGLMWIGGGPEVTLPFKDLDPKSPYFAAVRDAHQKGWFAGAGEQFEPERLITRAEAAVWLANGLKLNRLIASESLRVQTGFTDLEGLSLAERNAIVLLEALGLLKGEEFRPNDPLTVAEAASLAVHLHNERLRAQ